MLKLRVITAAVLLLLFLLALFALPVSGWAALVAVVVLQGASEWSRLSKLAGTGAYAFWALTAAMMLGLVWFDAARAPEQQAFVHLLVYSVSAVLWLIVVPAWLMMGWKVVSPYLMALVGWAVLIPTGLAMIELRTFEPAPWILVFVIGLVAAADISAYFAGRKFGKNKLAPSISPGKTWEGVAGAMLGVSVYVVSVWGFSPYFSQREVLPLLLLASWWWVVLAIVGDLFESAIKRQAGVKDSGALLPGHGGLLDRIDALTPTLPLAALAILLQRLT
jgi:phosphatidate cytidylyltransferase